MTNPSGDALMVRIKELEGKVRLWEINCYILLANWIVVFVMLVCK